MKTKFFSGGALATLAAALAFTAVPAAAQGWHRDNNQDHAARQDNNHRGGDSRPAWTTPAPQATNTPAANANRGNWASRGGNQQTQTAPASNAGNGPWHGWGDGSRVAQSAPATPNRTYVDPNRNQTYVDRNRNTTYRDAQRGDNRDWQQNRQNDGRSWQNNQRSDNRSWQNNQRSDTRDWQNNQRDNDRDWQRDRRDNGRTYRDARNDYQQWNRGWRDNDRYDWQRYRTYNRNVYHLGRYYAPYSNYYYQRLGIGFYLDPLFFGQQYWIGDPGYYRLPDVYGPYRWVRYYDDALLVNVYTGEVVDVIYDFFW